MKRSLMTAIALGLAFLPVADSAYAQCSPNSIACVPSRTPPGTTTHTSTQPEVPVPVVCFYAAENYKGIFFCEAGMRTVKTVPPQWRNNIKSLTVGDHTAIRICAKDVLQGFCDTIDRNTKKLEPGLINHVHSYDIKQH